MVLAYRVGINLTLTLSYFLTLGKTDLTSTSTATSTTIHLFLWRTITKPIVCHSPLYLHKVSTFIPLAFTITMYEFEATIATLWGHTMGTFHVVYLSSGELISIALQIPQTLWKNTRNMSQRTMHSGSCRRITALRTICATVSFNSLIFCLKGYIADASFAMFNTSLEQFWNCGHGLLARRGVYQVFWLFGESGGLLLWG